MKDFKRSNILFLPILDLISKTEHAPTLIWFRYIFKIDVSHDAVTIFYRHGRLNEYVCGMLIRRVSALLTCVFTTYRPYWNALSHLARHRTVTQRAINNAPDMWRTVVIKMPRSSPPGAVTVVPTCWCWQQRTPMSMTTTGRWLLVFLLLIGGTLLGLGTGL